MLESLFNKDAGRVNFPVNIAKFLRTAFFIEHLWWLLLHYQTPVIELFLRNNRSLFSQKSSVIDTVLNTLQQKIVAITHKRLKSVSFCQSYWPEKILILLLLLAAFWLKDYVEYFEWEWSTFLRRLIDFYFSKKPIKFLETMSSKSSKWASGFNDEWNVLL